MVALTDTMRLHPVDFGGVPSGPNFTIGIADGSFSLHLAPATTPILMIQALATRFNR